MKSSHVPSISLLRHLTRLTRRPTTPRNVPYCGQQRLFSCSVRCPVKRSTHARSPRARAAAKEIGASFASAHYDGNESLEEFTDVITSKWVQKDFTNLGLRYPTGARITPPEFVVSNFLGTMKNGWSPVGIAEWFSQMNSDINDDGMNFKQSVLSRRGNDYLEPLINPWIMGQALYILGYQFIMSPQKVQRDLGEYIFKVAVLMRNRDATLHVLVSTHRRKGAVEPAPQAFSTLKSLVEEGTDIEAMCLRAEMLRWPNTLKTVPAAQRLQAYDLALKALNMSEAGPPIAPPLPPRVAGPVACVPDVPTLPPWLILQRMGGADGGGLPAKDYPVWEKAVLAGAREYDDPEACLLAIDPASSIIPVGSADWIKFAMKAAMAGKPNASLLLGQYYLELHDWYPPKTTSGKRDKIGFQWVEVSISQMVNPPEIQLNAFLMALLLRENGEIKAALRWLDIGADRIEEVAKTRNANAAECARTMRFFEECLKEDWSLQSSKLPSDWDVEKWYFPDKLVAKASTVRR